MEGNFQSLVEVLRLAISLWVVGCSECALDTHKPAYLIPEFMPPSSVTVGDDLAWYSVFRDDVLKEKSGCLDIGNPSVTGNKDGPLRELVDDH